MSSRKQASQIPAAPRWLKGDGLAKWLDLWPNLDRSRIKPHLHSDTVAAYCAAHAAYVDAAERISATGAVVREGGRTDREGVRSGERIVVSPYVEVRDRALEQMKELGKILGISPDEPRAELSDWDDYAKVLL